MYGLLVSSLWGYAAATLLEVLMPPRNCLPCRDARLHDESNSSSSWVGKGGTQRLISLRIPHPSPPSRKNIPVLLRSRTFPGPRAAPDFPERRLLRLCRRMQRFSFGTRQRPVPGFSRRGWGQAAGRFSRVEIRHRRAQGSHHWRLQQSSWRQLPPWWRSGP